MAILLCILHKRNELNLENARKFCLTFFKTGNIITNKRVANQRKSSFVCSFFIS